MVETTALSISPTLPLAETGSASATRTGMSKDKRSKLVQYTSVNAGQPNVLLKPRLDTGQQHTMMAGMAKACPIYERRCWKWMSKTGDTMDIGRQASDGCGVYHYSTKVLNVKGD
jgi:hypothetical protein